MAAPKHGSGEPVTAAQAFGRFCAGLEYDALPVTVVERAKHFFIDYMAIALHASTLDSSGPVRALAAARQMDVAKLCGVIEATGERLFGPWPT